LGLSQDRLVFLGFEDKHLRTHVDEAARRVREVVNTFGACDLFVPFRAEYQDDHLAAWQIGRTSLPSHGRMYEYPVWFGPWLWRRLGWRARAAAVLHLLEARHAVKVCVSDVADMKRRALDAYASQVSAFERLGPWGRGFLDGFLGPYELFFVRR
jgi:LmbE family N-acetylglucosaminyl deacetylase